MAGCYVDFVTTTPTNPQAPGNSGEQHVAGRNACGCGPWWRLPLLLGLLLAAIVLVNVRRSREDAGEQGNGSPKPPSPTAADFVTLSIEFGDGRRQIVGDVPWRSGMTVEDLMQTAPRVVFTQQGSGAAAFVTSIGGVANEGAGEKNWMYSVNGERADRSFGIYELRPDDHVLWTFAPPK